jgi:hypothetical protein
MKPLLTPALLRRFFTQEVIMTKISLHNRWVAVAIACTLLSVATFGQIRPEPGAMGDLVRLQASFEQVAEGDLKALYLRCDRESRQRRLDFDEALRCTVAGEALKARSFGGDFNALLAWWRLHRD